jgi:hypothetical protein
MTARRKLTIASTLSILLFSLHWSDEIARGLERGTIDGTWGGLLILFVWSYGTLVIGDRRLGLIIMVAGALLASGVPVLHMQGRGLVGGRIGVDSSGALFWVWTNVALGVCGMIALALSLHSLRNTSGHRKP